VGHKEKIIPVILLVVFTRLLSHDATLLQINIGLVAMNAHLEEPIVVAYVSKEVIRSIGCQGKISSYAAV